MFLRIALPLPLRRLFDYLPPEHFDSSKLCAGVRVLVPFRQSKIVGLLMGVVPKTDIPYEKLKSAISIIDQEPLLSPDVFRLCEWAANYYQHSLGEVLECALPKALRQGKAPLIKANATLEDTTTPEESALQLNDYQTICLQKILDKKNMFQTFLLEGVTGSGKTEVYLQVIADILKDGKQVLVLVPEISLTPQTIARFRARFKVPMVTMHSGLSEKDRLFSWLKTKTGEAKLVIGTRSAIFASFLSLGLIVVDEEHDHSFKQQDHFRYHARDLAIKRASMIGIPVILGSATPSLESLWNVKSERYEHLSLPIRAGGASLPNYQVIDIRASKNKHGLSKALLLEIREQLDANKQVMLFLNRRGYAPILLCPECGWVANCTRCDVRLVYHRKPFSLQCHHCDAKHRIPEKCGSCNATDLRTIGLGTERLEKILSKHFKDVPLIRIDRDTTRKKGDLVALLEKIKHHDRAILLGTQMLAKGHHFPQVNLVALVDIDSGLFSSDFRGAEQTGQLLVQVSGRAGRVSAGKVIIQTLNPQHPLLTNLLQLGYNKFSDILLKERKAASLPPFSHFAVFRAQSSQEKNAVQFLMNLKERAYSIEKNISVYGPVSPVRAKRKGIYFQHLIIKTKKRSQLQLFLKKLVMQMDTVFVAHNVKWTLDVDPLEL